MKKRYLITIVSILTLLGALFMWFNQDQKNPVQQAMKDKTADNIKAGNLATDYSIPKAMEDIKALQLNTVNVPVVVNIEDTSASTMEIDAASLEKAKELIEKLKKRNIAIILEPYPWIANGSEYETEWEPENIEQFFNTWQTDILNNLIEEVANPYEVDVLNIGTSFNQIESFEDHWLDIIKSTQKKYNGLLTYRTSWWATAEWDEESIEAYEEKLNNPLFGELDFISIAAYFELTEQETNTVDELTNALSASTIYNRQQNIKEEIEAFHKKWNKPILFGELGFPKTSHAAKHPWLPDSKHTANNQEQANGFQTYKEVFSQEDWFLGFSIFAIGEDSSDKLYYPSEETIEVIKNW